MKLPQVFEQDIESRNVQLIPLLIIEIDDSITWFNPENADGSSEGSGERSDKLLSTHSLYLSHDECIESSPNPYGNDGFPDGLYFEPLLLDNPVVTEKIDVENRKYTISKCTFKISNAPYNGKRFSDILDKDGLMGKKVNFSYKSINSLAPISSVYFDQELIDTDIGTWGDSYDTYPKVSPTFYFGQIRDIQHNDEVVTITAEDLGSNYLHQQLPKNTLANNDSVIDSYRGARIPIVYGYMPRSPVVVGSNKKVYADSRPIKQWFRNKIDNSSRYGYPFNKGSQDTNGDFGSLFMSVDDHYCCIADLINYLLGDNRLPTEQKSFFSFSGYTGSQDISQITYHDDDVYTTKIAKFATNPLLSRSAVQLMVVYKPSKITLERRDPNVTWDEDLTQTYTQRVSLGDGDTGFGASEHTDANGQPVGGEQLTEEEFEYMTDGNFESTHTTADSDTGLTTLSKAMITSESTGQLERNRYKHSLFRFTIETEPPIEFINRGGICTHANQGTYAHWISFGHWVMPEQSINEGDTSRIIYTYAKDNVGDTVDHSYQNIRKRYYESDNENQDIIDKQYSSTNGISAMNDTWDNEVKLKDIVRFSDFHDHSTFGDINPTQIGWSLYESGSAKSPLQLYDVNVINETGDSAWDKQYSNPYAKFDNDSGNGKYYIHLGVFGFMSDLTLTAGNTLNWMQPPNPSHTAYNFDYQATMKGWLPEINCMSVCDTKIDFQSIYGSVEGRVDSNGVLIRNPVDIISDIFVNELGYPSDKIDQNSFNDAFNPASHYGFSFSFTQKDEINSKDLIEDIAKSTFLFPRIGFDGTLRFPSLKVRYDIDDKTNAIKIYSKDVIKYSYKLTNRKDLRTGTRVKYNYDHSSDKYFGDNNTKYHTGENIVTEILVQEDDLHYNGLEDVDDNIKDFESNYMRSDETIDFSLASSQRSNTIKKFQERSTHHYRNRHLIIKCQLPLKYLNIEPGLYLTFDELLGGIKAYGINYSGGIDLVNNQYVYPLFICTSVKKTIENVEIECMQLHDLEGFAEDVQAPVSAWGSNLDEDDDYVPGDQDEEISEEEEPVGADDVTVISHFDIPSLNQSSFAIYDLLNVDAGEIDLPYWSAQLGDFDFNEVIIFQELNEQSAVFEANGGNPLNFNDQNAGINAIFTPSNFQIVANPTVDGNTGSGGSDITSWNDLAPINSTVVTVDNVYLELLKIHFKPVGITEDEYRWGATLRNVNTELGGVLNFQWEVEQLSGHIWEGTYIPVSAIGWHQELNVNTIQTFSHIELFNYTEHWVRYSSGHDMVYISSQDIDIEEEDIGVQLGDVNLSGSLDVLDVVLIVNHVLQGTELDEIQLYAADYNQDGIVDILDIVTLVNHIVGNI